MVVDGVVTLKRQRINSLFKDLSTEETSRKTSLRGFLLYMWVWVCVCLHACEDYSLVFSNPHLSLEVSFPPLWPGKSLTFLLTKSVGEVHDVMILHFVCVWEKNAWTHLNV